MFVVSAKVLLKDPNKGGGDSKVLDALNIFSEKKIVENELIVLRSSSILQQVVRNLDLYTHVYIDGKSRLTEQYKTTSPVWFYALDKDTVFGTGRYYFNIDWDKKRVLIDNKSVPFYSSVVLGRTSFQVVPNISYPKNIPVKKCFVQIRSIPSTASSISGAIKANAISNVSTVLDVKLTTPAPDKGKDILEELM